jgi:hypothetical protein
MRRTIAGLGALHAISSRFGRRAGRSPLHRCRVCEGTGGPGGCWCRKSHGGHPCWRCHPDRRIQRHCGDRRLIPTGKSIIPDACLVCVSNRSVDQEVTQPFLLLWALTRRRPGLRWQYMRELLRPASTKSSSRSSKRMGLSGQVNCLSLRSRKPFKIVLHHQKGFPLITVAFAHAHGVGAKT